MQLDLFAEPLPVAPLSAIVALSRARQHPPCAFGQSGFGWLGPHHCWQCAVETERGCAEFAAAVKRGEYCVHGYTPNEAKKMGHRC